MSGPKQRVARRSPAAGATARKARRTAAKPAGNEAISYRVVPIDLTPPQEGFDQPEFGGARLKEALLELLPAAQRETIRRLENLLEPLQDLHEMRAMPYIYSYSSMAAAAAAVPVPWVDIPTVVTLQGKLVHKIGEIYEQQFGVDQLLSMAGVVGARLIFRQGIRELLKAVPIVGSASNAALAYATTFALGKAACWYFGRKMIGRLPSAAEFQQVLKEQTALAEQFWKRRNNREPKP